MATLMTIRPRFYNNDGTVASGGKLYTYAAGTTTPLTTYTTAAASVANTNPIILDSKGEADIWVTGVLKVNLLQSNDVQVTGFPIDNINFPSVTMWNDRGNFDASVNTYPTTGGSGVGNAIVTGDVWTISVVATSGPLNGQLLGTTVRALVDTPGQTGANWSILDVGLGASNAAAVAAAAAAAVSETNAATSASNASTSATNASNSASSASSSAASALAYAQAMSLNATTDTSASSVAIGTGAKTFTVTAGKSFVPGMFLVIADTAAPSTNSMYGQITSYSGTTLVVNVLSVLGSGTKTAWTISQTSAANLNVNNAGTTGTFTIQSSDFTVGMSGTATWYKNNNIVHLHIPLDTFNGTSDTGLFQLSTLPAEICPSTAHFTPAVVCLDNGSVVYAHALISTGGVISLGGSVISWTTSGAKRLYGTDFTWSLD